MEKGYQIETAKEHLENEARVSYGVIAKRIVILGTIFANLRNYRDLKSKDFNVDHFDRAPCFYNSVGTRYAFYFYDNHVKNLERILL